jgi:hypothetical protein
MKALVDTCASLWMGVANTKFCAGPRLARISSASDLKVHDCSTYSLTNAEEHQFFPIKLP